VGPLQVQPDEQEGGMEQWMVERAIVLQLLRDDHEQRWVRAELAAEIPDFERAVLDKALARLEHVGILHLDGDTAWAAHAARRLDELELISI
jgi:hypothetical protein